jgi:Protein of unknown function DUF262
MARGGHGAGSSFGPYCSRSPALFGNPSVWLLRSTRLEAPVELMRHFDLIPNHAPLTEFISWQRHKTLVLNPPFQRRSVWKLGARSYFIDTLIRGLPVPLVFLRERLNVDRQDIVREVVDGQQRLRTVLGFVDERLLPDRVVKC